MMVRWLSLGVLVLALVGCGGDQRGAAPPATITPPAKATAKPAASPSPVATSGPGRQEARVVRVIDGDTVELDGGQRVRYIGINTPEITDSRPAVKAWAEKAKEKNRELVEGKKVVLERDVSETDRYGRLLRYVYLDATMVNAELVRLGYAYATSYPPDVKHQDLLARLEKDARGAGRGLWGER
ncbi:MAG: thermonuclease family protein [Dehalococcoidia bacterium]|nr:thermonuclease family protein [Dehalococcoidia bacterium]